MWNVNLELVPEQMDGLLTILSYVLPLIDSINSIQGEDIEFAKQNSCTEGKISIFTALLPICTMLTVKWRWTC